MFTHASNIESIILALAASKLCIQNINLILSFPKLFATRNRGEQAALCMKHLYNAYKLVFVLYSLLPKYFSIVVFIVALRLGIARTSS